MRHMVGFQILIACFCVLAPSTLLAADCAEATARECGSSTDEVPPGMIWPSQETMRIAL